MTWNHFSTWVETQRRHLLDLVRIYLGMGLLIKGIFYLFNPELAAPSVSPEWMRAAAGIVPYLHICGGALLAVGLLTRFAAILQMPIVFAALSFVHLPQMTLGMEARERVEFSALVLFLLAVIAVAGPGPLSLAERRGHRFDLAPIKFREWSHSHADIFLDAVRIYLGLGLFIKGFYILSHQEQFGRLLENNGMPIGFLALAHYVIPAHFAGGAMLLLGFATRLGAISQLPLLIGALFYLYLPNFRAIEMRQNLEFTGLVLFLLALTALAGAGRFSLDHLVRRNERLQHSELIPAKA